MHQIMCQGNGEVAVQDHDGIKKNGQVKSVELVCVQEPGYPTIEKYKKNAADRFEIGHRSIVMEEFILGDYFGDREFTDAFS